MCRVLSVLLVLAVVTAFGQPQNERESTRIPRSLNYGNWVGKRVLTKDFMEKVGIKEEQAAKIKAEFERIDVQTHKIDESISKAALEQAEIAKKVLAEPGANTDEIMKIIERIGQYRTEQAKLATLRLVVIRDNLTAAQREKASEILNGEGKRRLEERAARLEREERERNAAQPNRPAATKNR